MKTQFSALGNLVSLASAGGGGGQTVRSICAGNVRLQVTYTGQHARVAPGSRVLEMNRAVTASGTRYVGGGYTWWTDGHTSELCRGETPGNLTSVRQCQAG